MDHSIKVRIADKVYRKTIHSEEEEAAIRQAATDLNETLEKISKAQSSTVSAVDIVTIAALNIGIERIELRNRLDNLTRGYDKLSADLQNYVDSLK